MIDGVKIVPLKLVNNERGHLLEIQRNDDLHFPGFGQTYITATKPEVIKAWYIHHKQIDQIALVKGNFKLVLFEPISKEIMEIELKDSEPKLVQIPVEVWHGFKNIGECEGILLHLNTIPIDLDHPDEDRLDSSSKEIPYMW